MNIVEDFPSRTAKGEDDWDKNIFQKKYAMH